MSSLRSGSLTESGKPGFSYAQAAKGRSPSAPSNKISSTAVSGTATPSSTSMSEMTPGSSWADDTENAVTDSSSLQKSSEPKGEQTPYPAKEGTSIETAKTLPASDNVTSPDRATTSSASTSKEDDSSSNTNGSSETTWESKSADEVATVDVETKETAEGTSSEAPKEQVPPKPVLAEAKPPAVNIWLQRAEAMKSKAPSPNAASSLATSSSSQSTTRNESERTRADARKKRASTVGAAQDSDSMQNGVKDWKKNESGNRNREEVRSNRRESRLDEAPLGSQRRVPPKGREGSTTDVTPPPVNNEISWPKPEDALEKERKKTQEKDDKSEKERASSIASKGHGKTEWKQIPFTPTAVFETTISGRGMGRMGRGGSARGSATAGGRGAHHGPAVPNDGHKSGDRATSLPNGEAPANEQVESVKADREAMPPPPAKPSRATSDGNWRDSQAAVATPKVNNQPAAEGNTVISDSKLADHKVVNGSSPSDNIAPHRRQSLKQQTSSLKPTGSEEIVDRQSPSATQTDDHISNGLDPTAKPAFPERRIDQHNADTAREPGHPREAKRGSRRGARGGANGHYSGHSFSQGYPDYQGAQYNMGSQQPFSPQRGGHFQQSRNSYRNSPSAMRSQSIPMDAYGRPSGPYAGYPMMPPMQGFMPDYYGQYPGPVPYVPTSERDMVMIAVASQVEYYFSIDNMVKDVFLRKHMDSQGYIFLDVIAQFNRLKTLTTDYELLKAVCLQSSSIEIRIGDDGKDRLRKVGDWERWLLPMEDRDPSARNDGPSSVRRPSESRLRGVFEQPPAFYPQSPASGGSQRSFARPERSFHMMNGGPPPFYPSGVDPSNPDQGYGDFVGQEETRGRQVKQQTENNSVSPLTNGAAIPDEETNGEPDKFPNSQIESLTVVVRKHEIVQKKVPYHTASSRTFSDGSIDSRNIMEEVEKAQAQASIPLTNGESMTNGDSTPSASSISSPSHAPSSTQGPNGTTLTLFWVKDREAPVDIGSLPADTTHELYTHLRMKALEQRNVAATGTCPYDMDVLYQFWSHFLIRNFNLHMYSEFRHLASDDATQRHSSTGILNLLKYYSESLASQIAIRDNTARDYCELVKDESIKGERPAFKQLRSAWRNGTLNLKNRKKLSDFLDSTIKDELES